MLVLGLTGSIASGKSTASKILSSEPYNLPIVDADLIARQVLEPGTSGYQKVIDRFGADVLQPLESGQEGSSTPRPIDRAALGRLIFGDSQEQKDRKAALNGIVHPAVATEMIRQVTSHYIRGSWCVVLDVPLLFDTGGFWDLICGCIATIGIDTDTQLQRLIARDSQRLTKEDALNRINSQMPFDEKAKRTRFRGADRGVVIMNMGTKDDLAQEISTMITHLRTLHPPWWSWLCLLCPPVGLITAAWSYKVNLQGRSDWKRQYGDSKRD